MTRMLTGDRLEEGLLMARMRGGSTEVPGRFVHQTSASTRHLIRPNQEP